MVGFRIEAARRQAPLASGPFHIWPLPDGTPWTEFYRDGNGGYVLRFPDLADFHVSADARQVSCQPSPAAIEAPETLAQHLYFNQVLPLVLSKQGKLVFHASAIEMAADSAIAFVAESGRGKSTLAASFAVNGYRFLCDDGLVVEAGTHAFEALPSQASIRLWEDSQQALIVPGAATAPALNYTSKSRFLAGDTLAFCAQPRALTRVYFLGDGSADALEIHPMSATEALVEWVQHSFLLDVEEKSRLASHFDQVARLAKAPIHYRLDYPRRFENLEKVRRAILDHANDARATA